MPAFATHYLFVKELEEKIQKIDPDITLDKSALYYGTQGPDFFLFGRVLPTMPGKMLFGVSSTLHGSDPTVLFNAMRKAIQKEDINKDIALSYAYGFLCHYALDSAAHPYVYARQKTLKAEKHALYPEAILHNQIEFNIDMILLDEKLGIKDARRFSTADLLSANNTLLHTMSQVMKEVTDAFNENLSMAQIKTAFLDFRKIQRLLQDAKGWKMPILKTLQLPIYPFLGPAITTIMRHKKPYGHYDYMNREHQTWAYPADPSITSNESVDELYEKGQKRALKMIAGFHNAVDDSTKNMEEIVGHLSFETGGDAREKING